MTKSDLGVIIHGVITVAFVYTVVTSSLEANGHRTLNHFIRRKWVQFRCKHPKESEDTWFDKQRDTNFRICQACAKTWYPEGK